MLGNWFYLSILAGIRKYVLEVLLDLFVICKYFCMNNLHISLSPRRDIFAINQTNCRWLLTTYIEFICSSRYLFVLFCYEHYSAYIGGGWFRDRPGGLLHRGPYAGDQNGGGGRGSTGKIIIWILCFGSCLQSGRIRIRSTVRPDLGPAIMTGSGSGRNIFISRKKKSLENVGFFSS